MLDENNDKQDFGSISFPVYHSILKAFPYAILSMFLYILKSWFENVIDLPNSMENSRMVEGM